MSKFFPLSVDFILEDYLDNNSSALVAGVDEVGRGCLCGSVVSAVVMVSVGQIKDLMAIGITDSKKLTAKRREALVPQIKELVTDCQISEVDSQTIDKINIFQASLLAMKNAIDSLSVKPDLCLIDGNRLLPDLSYPQIAIVKGDLRSPIIGAASILAKVWRDEQMMAYHQQYPMYDLAKNKGYGTKKHREAIAKYGLTPQHRLSFAPCKNYLLQQNKINKQQTLPL